LWLEVVNYSVLTYNTKSEKATPNNVSGVILLWLKIRQQKNTAVLAAIRFRIACFIAPLPVSEPEG
jgi:hypothetical protein